MIARACRWWLALAVAALAGCGGGGGGSRGTGTTTDVAGARTMSEITSRETGITYTLQLYVPPGYAMSTERYPVIYATDAEYRFTVLADVLDATHRKAILVNIGAMGPARRFVDFTMPGAEAYYRFLTRELIPSIDAQYRTMPGNRILSGHSLSGEFVVYALYLDRLGARAFSAFISEDGSFWDTPSGVFEPAVGAEPSSAMEAAMFQSDRNLPVTLVMAGDSTGNLRLVMAVHDFLAQRGYAQLKLVLNSYTVGHVAMDGPAFSDAMTVILGPP